MVSLELLFTCNHYEYSAVFDSNSSSSDLLSLTDECVIIILFYLLFEGLSLRFEH